MYPVDWECQNYCTAVLWGQDHMWATETGCGQWGATQVRIFGQIQRFTWQNTPMVVTGFCCSALWPIFFFLPHLWWTPRTIMLQCDECGMWRLLYSQFKLTKKERANLQAAIEDISFTCGAQLQDLGLSGWLNNVYTRELLCEDPIEKLYYSAKYRPICTYCAEVPKDRIHNVHVFTSQWCSKHVYFQPEFLW